MRRAVFRIAADAGIGIATARPRVAQPAREGHGLGFGNVITEHRPQRGHRDLHDISVGRVAIEANGGIAVGEAQQDRQARLLLVVHPCVEGAALLRRIRQPAEPFRLLRPEALRKAQVDLAEDAGAVTQPADRNPLRFGRRRIEYRQTCTQQADRNGHDRAIRFEPLAALEMDGHALPGPHDALGRHAVTDRKPARSIVDQRVKAAFGLGVTVEAFGREPFLGGHRFPRRALHALAHLDEGRHDQPVDLWQPGSAEQRLYGFTHRDRARTAHAGHRLALPGRPLDGSLESDASLDGTPTLAFAGRRRGTLVDQEALAMRFDQRDAELVAPQRQRIALDAMNPRAAEIDGRADTAVRPDAAAGTVARLEHGDVETGIVKQARAVTSPAIPAPITTTFSGPTTAHRPVSGHDLTRDGSFAISSNGWPPAAFSAAASVCVAPT